VIIPGLCSITFRNRTAEEIIGRCAEMKVPAIEWGGDIHVPHGDTDGALSIRRLCENQGILCPSYGSYFRVGESSRQGLSFLSVLNTAAALGCRTIRVWAGSRSPEDADDHYYRFVADETRRIADMAANREISISFEYHADTLTENPSSLEKLDSLICLPGIRYYWQPPHGYSVEKCLRSMKKLGRKMTNLHVFFWKPGISGSNSQFERRPLSEGAERWKRFIQAAERLSGDTDNSDNNNHRYAFLEFVRNNSFEQFEQDWKTLKVICS